MFPCFLTNARSLKNKLPELQQVLYSAQPKILCVCETWLTCDIPDNMLDPEQQYVIFRSDCRDRIGGGSCAFISRDLHSYEIEIPSDVDDDLKTCGCDILCFNIMLNCVKYRFLLIYRPPSSCLKTDLSRKTLSLVKVIDCPTYKLPHSS